MFTPGDICIVKDNKILTGLYRSLIGKQVVITSLDTVNDRYPIRVLCPDETKPWEWSSQLQMREDLLTKEC